MSNNIRKYDNLTNVEQSSSPTPTLVSETIVSSSVASVAAL